MWISMPHSCLSNQNNQDEHLAENTTRRDRTAISVQLYKTVWITRGDSLSWAVWLIWQEDPTGENTEAKVVFDGTRATYTSMSYGVTSATAQVLKPDHPPFLYVISLLYNWPFLFFQVVLWITARWRKKNFDKPKKCRAQKNQICISWPNNLQNSAEIRDLTELESMDPNLFLIFQEKVIARSLLLHVLLSPQIKTRKYAFSLSEKIQLYIFLREIYQTLTEFSLLIRGL